MDKNAWIKWILLGLAVIASLALVTPVERKVRLGLDLKGGSSFIVEVDREELRESLRQSGIEDEEEIARRISGEVVRARDAALEAIRNRVDGLGIEEPAIFPLTDSRIVIQMPGIDAETREDARRLIQDVAFLQFRLVHRQSDRWVRRLMEEGLAPPGFRIARADPPAYVRDRAALPDSEVDRSFWAAVRSFQPREGAEFFLERDVDETGATVYRPHYVETTIQMTGTLPGNRSVLRDARVDYDQFQRPKIALDFTGEGGRLFARITRDHAPRGERNPHSDRGRQLAIVLDDTLHSAPEIRTEITGGRGEITGRFSVQEAQRLVNVLRSGQLQARMHIVEERSVDPLLGRDSVRAGARAAVIGGVAVLGFMLAYYSMAGVVANLALLLTFLLLPLGALAVSGFMGVITRATLGSGVALPTLTLPGIAGIVLTLGMAVDANVLIYERIREEQKTGKTLLPAIDAGYDKAFSTILDANLTTLLVAVIMFWQGSGPVRGFAVMLSAGILVSLVTAVFATRLFFHLMIDRGWMRRLRMTEWIKDSRIDFLRLSRWGGAVSAVLLLASGITFFVRGDSMLGIDFAGGTSLTVAFDERIPTDRIRAVLAQAGVDRATIQYQFGEGGGGRDALVVKVPYEAGAAASEALTGAFSPDGLRILQQDSIGPQIGAELKRKGMLAVIWALLGMVLYISWRFEFSYAVAALVALFHDAVIAVGLFALMGRQLSMPMIAAVLTIVGYSVNDTIVIFDRIREARRLRRDLPYRDLANQSINLTLGRTLLTSATTLLCVLALLVFGGGAIRDFALLLLIGVVVGTYSTIFVATPITLLWHSKKKAA